MAVIENYVCNQYFCDSVNVDPSHLKGGQYKDQAMLGTPCPSGLQCLSQIMWDSIISLSCECCSGSRSV